MMGRTTTKERSDVSYEAGYRAGYEDGHKDAGTRLAADWVPSSAGGEMSTMGNWFGRVKPDGSWSVFNTRNPSEKYEGHEDDLEAAKAAAEQAAQGAAPQPGQGSFYEFYQARGSGGDERSIDGFSFNWYMNFDRQDPTNLQEALALGRELRDYALESWRHADPDAYPGYDVSSEQEGVDHINKIYEEYEQLAHEFFGE